MQLTEAVCCSSLNICQHLDAKCSSSQLPYAVLSSCNACYNFAAAVEGNSVAICTTTLPTLLPACRWSTASGTALRPLHAGDRSYGWLQPVQTWPASAFCWQGGLDKDKRRHAPQCIPCRLHADDEVQQKGNYRQCCTACRPSVHKAGGVDGDVQPALAPGTDQARQVALDLAEVVRVEEACHGGGLGQQQLCDTLLRGGRPATGVLRHHANDNQAALDGQAAHACLQHVAAHRLPNHIHALHDAAAACWRHTPLHHMLAAPMSGFHILASRHAGFLLGFSQYTKAHPCEGSVYKASGLQLGHEGQGVLGVMISS